MSPVAKPQVQMWCIWYRLQHNGTVFCIATTLGFMHLFLRRWCQWKSHQTLIGKGCGLETIFAWLLVCRYMYQQTHGTGAPLHLYAFPGSVSLVDDYRCIRKRNKVVLFQQFETLWPQSSKNTYCFGRCTTTHVEVMNDLRELEGVAVHRIYNSTLTTVFQISEITTKRKENRKIQHVGAGH